MANIQSPTVFIFTLRLLFRKEKMSAFNPEIAARALMPKELLHEASSLHLCLHLSVGKMQVALAEASGRDFLWAEDFFFETIKHTYADAVDFTTGRNWSEKVFRKCTLTYDTAQNNISGTSPAARHSAIVFTLSSLILIILTSPPTPLGLTPTLSKGEGEKRGECKTNCFLFT